MKKIFFMYVFALLTLNASLLKSDEYVIFVPNVAYDVNGSTIATVVEAWVYQKERKLGLTTALAIYMGLDKDKLTKEQTQRLYSRTQLFRVDSERNKELKIKFSNDATYALLKTDSSGRSSTKINLNKTIVEQNNKILFSIFESGKPALAQEGAIYYSPQEGISVISDIDDTIKYSNVLNTQELLLNTFFNDLRVIPGMNSAYQKIFKLHKNVSFHYVSSSPIQLYPLLQEFLDKFNFPKGSLHLREGSSWEKVIPTGDDSKNHKITAIKNLLKAFPKRKFILIGDSGESDPEVYASIKKEFDEQVILISIRDVTKENANSIRYKKIFEGIKKSDWSIF